MSSRSEALERSSHQSYDEPGLGERLANEALVLAAGTLGSLGHLKTAAEQAAENKTVTALKVGAGVAIGGTIGFLSARAGVAGLLARGAATAMGVSLLCDGIRPFSEAMSSAWNARSDRQLAAASGRLAERLGTFTFDTLLIAPFAMGGALAGRGLRAAIGDSAATTTARARTAPPKMETASNLGSGRKHTYHDAHRGRPSSTGSRQSRVLQGEIVEPVRKPHEQAKPREPEIIDAEFWEIPTHRRGNLPTPSGDKSLIPRVETVVPGRLSLIETATDAPLSQSVGQTPITIVFQSVRAEFNVVISPGHPLSRHAGRLLTELRAMEPSWRLEANRLVSPANSRLSPEQVARVMKAYTQLDTPTPGSIVNVRV